MDGPRPAADNQERPPGFRTLFISLLASLIGLAAGFLAYGLYSLIGLITNIVFFHRVALSIPGIQNSHLGAWIILVPVAGGLLVGVMVRYGSTRIRGHGIPEAMEAVVANRSRIEAKVAVLKPLSAAIAIGTGGPFGAEGPIIQTGGAIGSLVGQTIRTTAAERKVLLACGAGAGMAATFNTPIAAVILAIELLLFEFKSRSFIPLVISCTLATAVHFSLMGKGPLFVVDRADYGIPSGLPFYLLLGLLCGLAAVAMSKSLFWVEDQFGRLPIHFMWWPAIGALALGTIGYFEPRVLGVGYDTITDILNNRLALSVLLMILLWKSVALVVSLGSGTSGGLLAPMFMSGAAMGGAYATIVNHLFPGAHLSPGAYAVVGMAAVFGAAARAAFTVIIFAFEITRDYNAILPLMLACVVADGVALLLMPNSIMTEKLARRGVSIRQDLDADVFAQLAVREIMDPAPETVPLDMPLARLAERFAGHGPEAPAHQAFAVVDAEGRLRGIITRSDLVAAMQRGSSGDTPALEAASKRPSVAYPDESLSAAVMRMQTRGVGRLLVVERGDPERLVGYLGRSALLDAYARRLSEEHDPEPGWSLGVRLRRGRSSPSEASSAKGASDP